MTARAGEDVMGVSSEYFPQERQRAPPLRFPATLCVSQELQEMEEMSFREKVEMHSSNAYCSGCHSRIDPIGFSMENFSYFGQWRDT